MSVEDWAEIRRLHRSEGMPIKAIARAVGRGPQYGAATSAGQTSWYQRSTSSSLAPPYAVTAAGYAARAVCHGSQVSSSHSTYRVLGIGRFGRRGTLRHGLTFS